MPTPEEWTALNNYARGMERAEERKALRDENKRLRALCWTLVERADALHASASTNGRGGVDVSLDDFAMLHDTAARARKELGDE